MQYFRSTVQHLKYLVWTALILDNLKAATAAAAAETIWKEKITIIYLM